MHRTVLKIDESVEAKQWKDSNKVVLDFGQYGYKHCIKHDHVPLLYYGINPVIVVMLEQDYLMWKLSTNIDYRHKYTYECFFAKISMCAKEFPLENPMVTLCSKDNESEIHEAIFARYPSTGVIFP